MWHFVPIYDILLYRSIKKELGKNLFQPPTRGSRPETLLSSAMWEVQFQGNSTLTLLYDTRIVLKYYTRIVLKYYTQIVLKYYTQIVLRIVEVGVATNSTHTLEYCPSFTTEVVFISVALVAKPRVASQYHFNEKPHTIPLQMTWYHTMSSR